MKVAVEAEIGRRTGRQFLADAADATRYFDGSGVQEQEVDEIVSLTSVTVIGPPSEMSNWFTDCAVGRPPGALPLLVLSEFQSMFW